LKLLKALSDHLRDLRLIDDDRFDSWAEQGTLAPSGRQVITGSSPITLAYRLNYTAVLSWEGFTHDAYQLFAEVIHWLTLNCYDFDELGMPSFDVELEDNEAADIEITINFEESVYTQHTGDAVIVVDSPTPTNAEHVSVCGSKPQVKDDKAND